MKKRFCFLLQFVVLFFCVGCDPFRGEPREKSSFLYFDTVSRICDYSGDDEETFEKNCDEIFKELETYHRLLDIYNEYPANLYVLNKNAGGEPIEVDKKLVDFLSFSKEVYRETEGETNVMLGSVLKLWHRAIDSHIVPNNEELKEASKHTDIDLLEIDDSKNLVRITDSKASVDAGAIGKGYAAERIVKEKMKDLSGYVLDLGKSLRMVGTKPGEKDWIIGIEDPRSPESCAVKILLADISCSASGDYQRYFETGGIRYHHVIDKDTLQPARYFHSVTVITEDGGWADALSTALFCMTQEEGEKTIEKLRKININVEAIWFPVESKGFIKTKGINEYEKN